MPAIQMRAPQNMGPDPRSKLFWHRAPDKARFISIMPVSSLKSHHDDSNKGSNIGIGKEITQIKLIEVNFTHLIWCSVTLK